MLRAGSLFTGIGGMDLGFEESRCIDTVFQCEADKHARAVLEYWWPRHLYPRYDDVKTLPYKRLPEIDILHGGFPCQDVSQAGRRAGLAGERSGLWSYFLKAIENIGPRWVVIENVYGLLTSNGGDDFGTIIEALDKRGYSVAWRVLNSQFFGVPQRRRRLYIVGYLGSGTGPREVLFEPESGSGDSQASKGKGTTVNALSATGIGVSGADDNQAQAGHLIPTAAYYSHDYNQDRIYETSGVAPAVTAYDSNGSRNILRESAVRRLTPTECERLQGFPDGWTRHGVVDDKVYAISDAQRYKMLGNAVTVNVAEWIGRRLAEVDGRMD